MLYMFADIDECLTGLATCSQECVNTLGSYECQCYQGYKMEQTDCIGKQPYCAVSYIYSVYRIEGLKI